MAVLIPKQTELISLMCAFVPNNHQLAASSTEQPRLDSTELEEIGEQAIALRQSDDRKAGHDQQIVPVSRRLCVNSIAQRPCSALVGSCLPF